MENGRGAAGLIFLFSENGAENFFSAPIFVGCQLPPAGKMLRSNLLCDCNCANHLARELTRFVFDKATGLAGQIEFVSGSTGTTAELWITFWFPFDAPLFPS
jgi:hypothetical protein